MQRNFFVMYSRPDNGGFAFDGPYGSLVDAALVVNEIGNGRIVTSEIHLGEPHYKDAAGRLFNRSGVRWLPEAP